MSRLLDLDEVPDDLVSLIETLLDLIAANRLEVRIKKRYHDMPIWLLIEPGRTLQISLVLDVGRQRVDWSWHDRPFEDPGHLVDEDAP